jgi:hypothetical protein
MATATLLQDRENVGNNAVVAVDWLTKASLSTTNTDVSMTNALVILRTGTVSGPVEILLRVASPNDLNVLNPNPLNVLASSAFQYLVSPSSIRFDTIPAPWQTILNTTKFTDQAGAIDRLVIPPNAFIKITGGYGSYSSLLVPIAVNSLSLANAINLAAPNYFPLGPTEPSQTVTYSIGTSADLPTPFAGTLASQTTGIISYQDTYNITSSNSQTIQIGPVGGKVGASYFPSCILNIPPPTTISGTNLSASNTASTSSTLSSSIPFLTSSAVFPTNISVWSSPDATGTQMAWNGGQLVLTDAVMTRSDYGNSTIFIDSIFYSYFNSATTALAHSIAVESLVESLLNQESQTLLLGGGQLLGVSVNNLTGS